MNYTIIIATAVALASLWLRVHVRHLPPGSRIPDLVFVDMGRTDGR